MSLTLKQRLAYGERPEWLEPEQMYELVGVDRPLARDTFPYMGAPMQVSLHFNRDVPLGYAWDGWTETWVRADLLVKAMVVVDLETRVHRARLQHLEGVLRR